MTVLLMICCKTCRLQCCTEMWLMCNLLFYWL